jgi:hypothetical protein
VVPTSIADTAEQRTAAAAGVTLNGLTRALMGITTAQAEPWVCAAVYADAVQKDADKAIDFLDRALLCAPRCKTALLIKVRILEKKQHQLYTGSRMYDALKQCSGVGVYRSAAAVPLSTR